MEIHASRSWGWVDWFMVGLRVFGFAMIFTNLYVEGVGERLGFVISFAVLSLAVPQLFYLPGHIRPTLFILTELAFSGGFTLFLTSFQPEAISYLYLPALVVSYMGSRKAFYWIAPVCALLLPFGMFLFGRLTLEGTINVAVNLAVFLAFGFGFGVFLRQKHQLSGMLQVIEEKNRALEHSIKQVERLTLLEERNRMARELHDTVGHSLTASIVAMEAVRTLMDRNPEASKERLKQLIQFSRGQLDQFRQTVHDMAMNELKQPLTELLSRAADAFANQTGMNVVLEQGDEPAFIPEAVKLSMLRCLQESMTNAKKHGNATEIRITVKRRSDALSLRIQDNGSGTDELSEGFGVEGMRARVEALRGTLRIASKQGEGTTVSCEIPIGG
jgi:signal transduction histidine kinase